MADILQKSPQSAAPSGQTNPGTMKIWARATAHVQGTPQELYALWRDVESTPRWQENVADVIATGPTTSRWVLKFDGKIAEWDSEIHGDEPGRRIAWHSVGANSNHAGEAVFETAPRGRGTIVTVFEEFRQDPSSAAAQTIFSRNLRERLIENLRQFKAFAEARDSWASAA
jgi:uncharacterized membrane protein